MAMFMLLPVLLFIAFAWHIVEYRLKSEKREEQLAQLRKKVEEASKPFALSGNSGSEKEDEKKEEETKEEEKKDENVDTGDGQGSAGQP